MTTVSTTIFPVAIGRAGGDVVGKTGVILAVVAALSVAGCASPRATQSYGDGAWSPASSRWNSAASSSFDAASAAEVIRAIQAGVPRSKAIAAHGMELLRTGELDQANAVLNSALKLDIGNAPLHLLNGVAYHLRYLRGESDKFELARAAYLAALENDDGLVLAFVQIGRLFLDARQYGNARQAFAEAVALEHDNTAALYGLAHAALYDGDVKTAVYAKDRLHALQWNDPLLARLEAALFSMAGKANEAAARAAEYQRRSTDATDARYFMSQLPRLQRTALPVTPAPEAPSAPASAPGKSGVATVPGEPWFRCDAAPGIPQQQNVQTAPSVNASDETLYGAVLPRPCPGERPPLAVVEVTMVRTEETESKKFGVNLLDGLTAVFKSVRVSTRQSGAAPTTTLTRTFGFAGDKSASDFLVYSLNIANAAYAKNEVIARPTLAVVDRVPSLFFSGANITLGVVGQAGGASTVVDKPVGVSLAVTPTFVDNDSVLVSVRATRSFIEDGLTSGPAVLLQQTRNMVNASAMLRFGESFVLTGLVERELDRSASGVPVIGDLPVIQYLFRRDERLDFRRQILTIVTVRKVVTNEAEAELARDGTRTGISTHKISRQIDEYLGLQKNRAVVDELLELLPKDNRIYRRLRDRDVIQESWSSRDRLQMFTQELRDMIYF